LALTASLPSSARTSESVIKAGSGSEAVSTRFVILRSDNETSVDEEKLSGQKSPTEKVERCVIIED